MDVFDFRERAGSGVHEETEALPTRVIGAMIDVHKALKPGLPESVYRNALCYQLELLGIAYVAEYAVPIHYKGRLVGQGTIDIFVEGQLVLELKAVEALSEVHHSQVLTYLQSLDFQLGLLANFNVPQLRGGLKRIINTYTDLRA